MRSTALKILMKTTMKKPMTPSPLPPRSSLASLLALALPLVAGACHDNPQGSRQATQAALAGTLAVELRDHVRIELSERDDADHQGAFNATLHFDAGAYGLWDGPLDLTGVVRVEPFPEAEASLYVAKLSAPTKPGGPCGARPISLALSLLRRGEEPRVSGALTAYCGDGTWTGKPARLLRLSGTLAKPQAGLHDAGADAGP